MAAPPVTSMAVRAAPRSVPATPNLEVTKDAPVAASPADMIWGVVTTGFPLFALTAVESNRGPRSFKGRWHFFGGISYGLLVAADDGPRLECPAGERGKVEA